MELNKSGHEAGPGVIDPQVQLSFIMMTQKVVPTALRLDGIYFNTRQDWGSQNEPIRRSFEASDLVVYQSNFNKRLTEAYFGDHKKSVVINNGTCFETISKIQPLSHPELDKYSEVWSCGSSWRPHKRLKDNIDYFLENAPEDSCMVVAGENPDHVIKHPRVFYVGQLSWEQCISLYKRSKVFVHLAFLDHCPNVVVDARASGCELVVASSGGTKEIAGPNAIIVEDLNWDMQPLDLYSPPKLDLSNRKNNNIDSTIDIISVSQKYIKALESIL
jgi:glycosyltransferase involved in cell wall biosynthesis